MTAPQPSAHVTRWEWSTATHGRDRYVVEVVCACGRRRTVRVVRGEAAAVAVASRPAPACEVTR